MGMKFHKKYWRLYRVEGTDTPRSVLGCKKHGGRATQGVDLSFYFLLFARETEKNHKKISSFYSGDGIFWCVFVVSMQLLLFPDK